MELYRVIDEIHGCSQRLSQAADSLFLLAKKKAESEREYRHALALKIMELRDQGLPATLIGDMARGELAELLFQRDLAESRYRAGIEAVDALKSQLSALQTIIKFQRDLEGLG